MCFDVAYEIGKKQRADARAAKANSPVEFAGTFFAVDEDGVYSRIIEAVTDAVMGAMQQAIAEFAAQQERTTRTVNTMIEQCTNCTPEQRDNILRFERPIRKVPQSVVNYAVAA